MRDVIVIGGGPSGLAAATALHRAGRDVLLLEAAHRVGGNIRTHNVRGHLMERGPHSFLGSAWAIWKLVEHTGLDDAVLETHPESRERFIWRDGKLRRLPAGFFSAITTSILTPGAKLRLLGEPFVKGGALQDDTVDAFFRRRFGDEAAEYLAGPFVSCIYAGDARAIGARASFPTLWQAEKDHGSVIKGMLFGNKKLPDPDRTIRRGLFTIDGGLGRLANAMAEQLGDRVVTRAYADSVRPMDGIAGWEIDGMVEGDVIDEDVVWQARSVVLACPPDATASLVSDLDVALTHELQDIPFSSVVVVHMAGPDPSPFPQGFGFGVPRSEGIETLGTVCVSSLFPGRAPKNRWLATSFIGGSLNPKAIELTDDHLTDKVLADNSKLVGHPVEPDLVRVLKHPAAIPQLLPDHPERVTRIESIVRNRHRGLFLAGNYLQGVGIKDAAASGLLAADAVEAWLARE